MLCEGFFGAQGTTTIADCPDSANGQVISLATVTSLDPDEILQI